MHKFKGPCVSDSLKNFLNGNADSKSQESECKTINLYFTLAIPDVVENPPADMYVNERSEVMERLPQGFYRVRVDS